MLQDFRRDICGGDGVSIRHAEDTRFHGRGVVYRHPRGVERHARENRMHQRPEFCPARALGVEGRA